MLREEHGLVRPADSGQSTWNCGVSEEKVSFHWDLVPGVSISFADRPGVGLDPVIELRPSACLKRIEGEVTHGLVPEQIMLFLPYPRSSAAS